MTGLAVRLPKAELCRVLEDAKVLSIMSHDETRQVTVAYFPPRAGMVFPMSDGDDPIEAYPINPILLTFKLEDTMFGGEVWAAITCGDQVVIRPFPWISYENLGTLKITVVQSKG